LTYGQELKEARGVKSALTTLCCLLSVALLASAQNQTPQDAASPWLPRETLTGEWFGQGATMSDRGVEVFANYTAEVWGNTVGGLQAGSVYKTSSAGTGREPARHGSG
jgi:carbohydrate-selective porin OprB